MMYDFNPQTTHQVREALRNNQPVTSLATLTRVAIEDGRGLDPNVYIPDYGQYHKIATVPVAPGESETHQRCKVCLAGAAIVGTLAVRPEEVVGPQSIREDRGMQLTSEAIIALDRVRTGFYATAYSILGIPLYGLDPVRERVPYARQGCFVGFEHFRAHLDDLELRVLPALRDFEVKLAQVTADRAAEREAEAAADRLAEQERAARAAKIEALEAERARIEAALDSITYEGDDEGGDDA